MYRNRNWNKKDRIKKEIVEKDKLVREFLEIPNLCSDFFPTATNQREHGSVILA